MAKTKTSELVELEAISANDLINVSQDQGDTTYISKKVRYSTLDKRDLTVAYLTYDGTSGTPSGTKGCTLTGNGKWTVTDFNTAYYCDDDGGNLEITIPDADAINEGQRMYFVKPRLVRSDNEISIVTEGGQYLAQKTTYPLLSSGDTVTLISVPFSADGSLTYKYRMVNSKNEVNEVIEVSTAGNQLFDNIKDAVDYANTYATHPVRIKVNPGTYEVNETIIIDCPYPMVIEGMGTETTIIRNGSGLIGMPMFAGISNSDFSKFTIEAVGGYGSTSLENGICYKNNSANVIYFEIHQIAIYGCNRGVSIAPPSLDESSSSSSNVDSSSSSSSQGDLTETEGWIFDSIINNCEIGIYCNGGSFGTSEMTLDNNGVAIDMIATSNDNKFSIQNVIFGVNNTQIGIRWTNEGNYIPVYHAVSGNIFDGDGTYLSGLNFYDEDTLNKDVLYSNNLGLESFLPSSYIEFEGNTTTTTLTDLNVYYKMNGTNTADSFGVKYSIQNNRATYLPTASQPSHIIVTGDIQCDTTNQTLSVALYKNGTTLLSSTLARCVTADQGVNFSIQKKLIVDTNDYFEIYASNQSSGNRVALIKNMGFSIVSQ